MLYPYEDYAKFNLQEKDSADDITLLAEALAIPDVFKCHPGTVCDGTEGLYILLKRFADPCRYSDMVPCFGRPVPELAMISNKVIGFLFENHHHRLTPWNHTILNHNGWKCTQMQ